jgi:hypothetical protein
MLPTSNYDAFYVQHPVQSPFSEQSNSPSTYNQAPFPFQNPNGVSRFPPSIDYASYNPAFAQAGGNVAFAGSTSQNGLPPSLMHAQQQFYPNYINDNDPSHRQNWHPDMSTAPSSSKSAYPQQGQGLGRWQMQDQIHATLPNTALYASQVPAMEQASPSMNGNSFVQALHAASANHLLDPIGDDSGSGGTTRPKPRKRRRTAKSTMADIDPNQTKDAEAISAVKAPLSATASDASFQAIQDQFGLANVLQSNGSLPASDYAENVGGALQQNFDAAEDEPLYVNPKQYNRILKRREVRARMEEKRRRTEEAIRTGRLNLRDTSTIVSAKGSDDEVAIGEDGGQKRPYQHESRHKHAMRRPRGPGGRFLTAEEIKAKEASEAAQHDGSEAVHAGELKNDESVDAVSLPYTDDPSLADYDDLLNLDDG